MKSFSRITLFFGSAIIAMLSIVLTPAHAASKGDKLVFAIDGLSFEAFQIAQKHGLFPSFRFSGRHIAPYPSMTEPSWTEILGGKKLFPLVGNVGTVEATYFDIDQMKVNDDLRNAMIRPAQNYNFFRAFDYYFNPILESLMYFPNEATTDLEIEQLQKAVTDGFTGDHFIAYVSEIDAIAHTQKDKLYPVLAKLSATIENLIAERKKLSPSLETWIISDHGNAGGFQEGEEEKYLTPVSLQAAAARAGLKIVDKELKKDNQIAIPILALGNIGNVYFKDLSKRRKFALRALEEPFVELVTYLEVTPNERFITILGPSGEEARLYWGPQGYAYQAIRGNPLRLETRLISPSDRLVYVQDRAIFEALAAGPYPDAAYRLVQAATKQIENEADLEINLRDGYCFEGTFSQRVRMVRTHGALSAKSSLGLVASTDTEIPAYNRSQAIMGLVGITPTEAFHQAHDLFHEKPESVLAETKKRFTKGIPSRVTELSNDLIFRRIIRAVQSTMDFLSADEVKAWKEALDGAIAAPGASLKSRVDEITLAIKRIDPFELMNHLDEVYAIKGKIDPKKDPKELAVQLGNEVTSLPGLSSLKDIEKLFSESGERRQSRKASSMINLGRQAVMKLYTAPYVLDEILNIQEYDNVPDPRDLGFAEKWFGQTKKEVLRDPGLLVSRPELAQKLFQEIFTERKLLSSLSPATFPLLYNAPAKDVTVVYVPGIYNELFDTEIFAKGIRALRANLGVRVIYADVDGRCTAEHNSKKLYEFLREDTRKRLERGYSKPRYVILGYSKGGVDSTEALLVDPAFTRSQVLGLVTIASPHHGSSILETVDLPQILVDQTVSRPIPEDCRAASGSQSGRRAQREAFWMNHVQELVGLTRFYSISFASSVEESHPWMKITKNIARFQQSNDGVVTVESSKFPGALGAVDLGTINADHLAGIAASHFPQGPFLEAILLTLLETKSFDANTMAGWYQSVAAQSSYLSRDYIKRTFASRVLQTSAAVNVWPVSVVGPLPSTEALLPTDEDQIQGWYAGIAREQGMLKSSVKCATIGDANRFSKELARRLKGTEFALRPFTLSCDSKGVMTLTVTTSAPPVWKFWQKPVSKKIVVRNLDDLVTGLLSNDLGSGKNPLAVAEGPPSNLPKSDRKPLVLPKNNLGWDPFQVINLRSFNSQLESSRVEPMLPASYPDGVRIVFDHSSVKDFRREYGFSYESTSPDGVDDNAALFFPVLETLPEGKAVALRMRSDNNSIRVTSPAIRFRASDFPRISMEIKVNKGPVGADSALGGSGKDDSAFQVWFTLRDLTRVPDRSQFKAGDDVKIFGYYWAEKPARGSQVPTGAMVENYYSKKNFVIASLPEAFQIALGSGDAQRGQWLRIDRDLLADLKQAFPKMNVSNFEIVGITFQGDSNDTHTDSEALFRELNFTSH